MDPLTHTAIGFTLAQAGAKRWTPNWKWVILLASGAPDVDTIPFPPGNVEILNWHRHFTHSLFCAPLVALAVVLFVRYVLRREVRFWGAWGLATLGVVAHDLIDLCTFRGIRILLPFDDRFHALGLESFFDPVLYAILALGLAGPFLSNLVNSEIGARKSSGTAAAWVTLALVVSWLGARWMLREQALAELNSRVYDGWAPRRATVMATQNPLRFHGFVEGPGLHRLLDVNLLEYFDPEAGQTLYHQVFSEGAGKALRVASMSHSAQVFLSWAKWPRPLVTRLDGDTRWVVVWEELAVESFRTRAKVIIRLGEDYAIQSEVYERSKSATGL
jgi:inner membrane protein